MEYPCHSYESSLFVVHKTLIVSSLSVYIHMVIATNNVPQTTSIPHNIAYTRVLNSEIETSMLPT